MHSLWPTCTHFGPILKMALNSCQLSQQLRQERKAQLYDIIHELYDQPNYTCQETWQRGRTQALAHPACLRMQLTRDQVTIRGHGNTATHTHTQQNVQYELICSNSPRGNLPYNFSPRFFLPRAFTACGLDFCCYSSIKQSIQAIQR